MIHCFGDSHIEVFTKTRPDLFRGYGVLSKTAFKVGNTINTDAYIQSYLKNIPLSSKILVSFGEIDCRRYVVEISQKTNTPIEDVVSNSIDGLKQLFKYLLERYKRVAALAPVPSLLHQYHPPDVLERNRGSWEEIFIAKQEFHLQMQTLCEFTDVWFLSVFNACVEEKWFVQPDVYYHDATHLNESVVPKIINQLKGF